MKEEIITFSKPSQIYIDNKPSSFNSFVRVEKYKITIEKLKEPKKIICQRLEKLWIEESNHHQYKPLQEMAIKLKYTFKGKFGENKKNEKTP
jgi:hypothetical protein